jgi:hypothetical protein
MTNDSVENNSATTTPDAAKTKRKAANKEALIEKGARKNWRRAVPFLRVRQNVASSQNARLQFTGRSRTDGVDARQGRF